MTWCLVSREYPPFSGGGIGTYAHSMTRAMVRSGEHPIVITVGPGERTEGIEDGVTVVRLPLAQGDDWSAPHPAIRSPETRAAWQALGPHSVFAMQVADELESLIVRYGIDLVEFADTGAAGWFALNRRQNLGTYGGVRMITHVHSPSAWIERTNRRCEPGRAMHELQRMEREQARWSDAVITPSHFMAGWVQEHWGVSASVIRYPRPVREEPHVEVEEAGVLFVGRLEYRKGIDTLLSAWSRLKPDARLHLVGTDTPDERTGVPIGERLISQMPREAALSVVEHGPKQPAEVNALQHAAEIVVVPSPEDDLPFTCIEAMSAGRVVIVSDIGGASELIEDGVSGLIFKSGCGRSLAETLGRALAMDAGERERMGERAAGRIEELCNPEHVLLARREHAGTIEHWREILSDPECVMINAQSMISASCERLCGAVTSSGADFAIGWPRVGDRVIAHGTPSLEGLVVGPRELGPIVIRRSWLERPEIQSILPAQEPSQVLRVREAWKLLALVMSHGARGVAVPEAVCELAPPEGPVPDVDMSSLVRRAMVAGEPGLPVGRAVRLVQAFEEQGDTIKSRVMGTARKLLGG